MLSGAFVTGKAGVARWVQVQTRASSSLAHSGGRHACASSLWSCVKRECCGVCVPHPFDLVLFQCCCMTELASYPYSSELNHVRGLWLTTNQNVGLRILNPSETLRQRMHGCKATPVCRVSYRTEFLKLLVVCIVYVPLD